MRATIILGALAPALGSCSGILGIPSESSALCEDQCVVTIAGSVLPVDSATAAPKANVRVALTSLPMGEVPRVTSNASGGYSFADLDINTALELEMSFDQTNPTVPSGVLVTRFLGGNADMDRTVDVPVVEFRWLAKVAFECGIFPTLEEATFEPGTSSVNFYYISRSTVIGEVQNEDGTPATLNRSDLTVTVDGYMNSHQTPGDDTFPPRATVCFLEPDTGTGTFVGVNAERSTSGRFVMFRVRDEGGTGRGYARVLVPGFPPGAVNLRSSGSVGYVRIRQGEGEAPLPSRPITFERDIYPLFTELTCVACHRPGGPGYEMGMVRGGLRADFSGTLDEVFQVLTGPPSTGCENGGDMAARVCTARPEVSLLYTKPRLETGSEASDHKGIAFPEDTLALKLILEWIKNDAPLR
jgi:hypothetical protein